MGQKEFEVVVTRTLDKVRSLLLNKGEEYARGDRFSNFKQQAMLKKEEPEMALLGNVSKQITSLYDHIRDLPGKVQPYEKYLEKTNDIIVYMILLNGVLEERLQEKAIEESRK